MAAPVEEVAEAVGEHEATVEELLASMDTLADTVGLTDNIDAKPADAAADVDAMLDEISFDDLIEDAAPIDAPVGDAVDAAVDAAIGAAADPVAELAPEEISFDSLEALFKDEQ